MHFGIVSPPVPGHLNPFGALGRELIARGHRVTLFHVEDLDTKAAAEGLEFVPIGQSDHPKGSLARSLAQLGTLDGLAALRFTIGEITRITAMMLRDAPGAMKAAGIDALLVDQTEPGGSSIAERLNVPFITVCNALMLNREPTVPPAFSNWTYGTSVFHQLRNRLGYAMTDQALKRLMQAVNMQRRAWGMRTVTEPETTSKLAQISQQCPAFDYPRRELPPNFHYTGPLRRSSPKPIDFPWDKLDGCPLVYASLGTLQNGKERVFRMFAEACVGRNVQLVITHGGGLDPATAASFPGNPLVVSYAPQTDVLRRASLTLTHAGLNTMLDSLSFGVPLVAVPITFEQPAIAKRMEWCGAGQSIPFLKLSVDRIRAAMDRVLGDPKYTQAAARVKSSIQESGGVSRAADIVESALRPLH